MQAREHPGVRAIAAGGEDGRARRDARLGAVRPARHDALAGQDPRRRRAQPQVYAVSRARGLEDRRDRLEDRSAAIHAPVGARDRVGLVEMQDRRAGRMHLEADLHQPVDRARREVDGAAHQRPVREAAADPHHVGVVQVGAVLDATRALQLRSRRAHLAGGIVERAADAPGLLEHDDLEPARGSGHGGGQASRAGADHGEVEGLAHRPSACATLRASGVG